MGTTARALPILGETRAIVTQAAPVTAEPMGFFTDTTVCIGCKACEVACKEWNQLPARGDGGARLACACAWMGALMP